MGEWVNAAYAACPSTTGCRIHIQGQQSCYSYSTPIVLNTNGKNALLEGDTGGQTCLTWVPGTGTAVTLDWGGMNNAGPSRAGIQDISFRGPGSATSTTMLQLGGTNGCVGCVVFGVADGTGAGGGNGFGTVISLAGLVQDSLIQNSEIQNCTTGLSNTTVVENIKIVSVAFSHCTTAIHITSNASDMALFGVIIDDNNTGININNALGNPIPHVSCTGCRFENSTVPTGGSNYIVAVNGSVTLNGGAIWEDRHTGTNPQFIKLSGASKLGVYGTYVLSGGATITQLVSMSGSSYADLHFQNTGVGVKADFTPGFSSGQVIDMPLNSFSPQNMSFNLITMSLVKSPLSFTEQGSVPGAAASGTDQCYGDSAAHALKCSYNGSATYLRVPQVITASLTTTAATTDKVTVNGMTASGHCYLTATNSGAAGGIASVFISAKTTNQITVTHAPTSGWTFDVVCSPQ